MCYWFVPPRKTIFAALVCVVAYLHFTQTLTAKIAGELGVMRGIEKIALSVVGCCQLSF